MVMKLKNPPEVFVDLNWSKTINFILFKLEPNKEFILKANNNRMFRMAFDCVIKTLCEERKFYKKIGRITKEGNEIKIHLVRIGVGEE